MTPILGMKKKATCSSRGSRLFEGHRKVKTLLAVVYSIVPFNNSGQEFERYSNSEFQNVEEIVHKPAMANTSDRLFGTGNSITELRAPSTFLDKLHIRIGIVGRLLFLLEKYKFSTDQDRQKLLDYCFIDSVRSLLNMFRELQTFFEFPANFTPEVALCHNALKPFIPSLSSLLESCSEYLEINKDSDPDKIITLQLLPPLNYPLNGFDSAGSPLPLEPIQDESFRCADFLRRVIEIAKLISHSEPSRESSFSDDEVASNSSSTSFDSDSQPLFPPCDLFTYSSDLSSTQLDSEYTPSSPSTESEGLPVTSDRHSSLRPRSTETGQASRSLPVNYDGSPILRSLLTETL